MLIMVYSCLLNCVYHIRRKKTSGLIFTGALLTTGRVVGRKGRMMVMVMTCCHYCDSSDNDSNDIMTCNDQMTTEYDNNIYHISNTHNNDSAALDEHR